MALTNAQKQAAWRARRDALASSAASLQKRVAELEIEVARLRNQGQSPDAVAEARRQFEQERAGFLETIGRLKARLGLKAPLTPSEFNKLVNCVHPDRVHGDPELELRYTEALRILNDRKDLLVRSAPPMKGARAAKPARPAKPKADTKKERAPRAPVPHPPTPSTAEEWKAMRKKR